MGAFPQVFVEIRGTSKLCVELPLVMGTIPLCLSGRPTPTVFSPYPEWLHLAFPEPPERTYPVLLRVLIS